MSTDRLLTVVTAGLSQPSSTRLLADRLATATTDELQLAGLPVRVEVVELRDHAHAIVDAMLTGFASGDLAEAVQHVEQADGLVAVTPVFTASYSGLFKSFADILDPAALTGVPVLLGATGGTERHTLALEYALRPLLAYLHADVVPTSVFAATADWAGGPADGARGDGSTGALAQRIARAGRELATAMGRREPRGEQPDPFADAPSFSDLLGR
ncbi:FMN reductase [Isoptericola croceus]|uniref:FMN reductase n=1 Tax=Isoptericola croceus TaxID=3031406 RepID=UPI0023F7C266|nr:FMN reductase [Isoptericola croceus]